MATEKTISARMQMKTDTALNWSKAINFIPKKGEIIIYEADSDYGYERMKIGDGSTKVNDLPFVIGAKDWNQNDSTASDYIKNRPFYTGEMVQTEIIPEHTYTLSSAGSFTMYEDQSGTYPYSLEDGKNYIVVYNGTTYELTSSNTDGIPYVGDIGPLRGEEATVPFVIMAYNGMLQIADYNGNTEVTFKIIGDRADIIQIDLKYIPELPRYMSKQNPVGYGSFSLNRKADTTVGLNSHAEGYNTTASGNKSHAEGSNTTASGNKSHAEGSNTTASGNNSHAEGSVTTASGNTSHAEGYITLASGSFSHAEGSVTTASGDYSHAEGSDTTASGMYSHAEGFNTKASGKYSHVQGKYNIEDLNEKYAHIVGNGTSDTARSNAHTLDWEGNAWYAGTVEGTAMIVKSSTPRSTKKFKITVDDTGTISATEVTT